MSGHIRPISKLNEWGNRTDMSHWMHSTGTAVEWQLDVVIDICLWISTESGSIVTRVLFNFSLLNAVILARIDLRPHG